MWIVKLALRRPYTFIVMALGILIIGAAAIRKTPTDIFPEIDIPVVSVIWTYNGLPAEDMAKRITTLQQKPEEEWVKNRRHPCWRPHDPHTVESNPCHPIRKHGS